MKRPKLSGALLFMGGLLAYLMFVKRHYAASKPEAFRLPPQRRPASDRPALDRLREDGPASDRLPDDGPASDRLPDDGPASDRLPEDGPASDRLREDGPASDRLPDDGPASDRLPDEGPASDRLPDEGPASAAGRIFQYGIMFDAGSTGTRIHIFKFQMENNEAPKLAHETFRAIKPGLSAYADDPEKCTAGIVALMEVAKSSIPPSVWTVTPVVLKATAGLRLLPGEKAQQLLDRVRALFLESPFLSRDDSVSIMDGTDEGISAWITVNFLTGDLHIANSPTVGMLDLGGGSTQITFSPQDKKTIQTSPIDFIRSFRMFNNTHTVYTHSYLGLGLMSARLAVLGGVNPSPLGGSTELVSACLPAEYSGQWEHADVLYSVRGQKAGDLVYEACRTKVEKVLYRKVEKASEAADVDFYAFSYYYDRAVDLGVIEEKTGGTIKVSDYINAAKRVCGGLSLSPQQSPFLCLDLVYISVLLQELGFPPHKQFKLARTIHQVETSWALGATFHYIESLK